MLTIVKTWIQQQINSLKLSQPIILARAMREYELLLGSRGTYVQEPREKTWLCQANLWA